MVRPITIQGLLLSLAAATLVTVFAIEVTFLIGYQQQLLSSAGTLMTAKLDQLYADFRVLWYSISRISSMISRSMPVRDYVTASDWDERVRQNLQGIVDMAQMASDEVVSLMITDFNNLALYAYRAEDYAVLEHARNALAQGLVVRSPVHLQMGRGESAVTYCINCTDPGSDGSAVYTLLIYNVDPIRKAFAELQDEYITIFLLDGEGATVMASRAYGEDEVERVRDALAVMRQSPQSRQNNLQVRRLSLLRWQLVAVLDERAETVGMRAVWRFAVLTDVFLIIGISIFLLVLKRQIDAPVRRILRHMRRVAAGQTRVRLELDTHNELSAIQDGMNEMLTRLDYASRANEANQQRLFALQLARKQAELAALTSQINPHFLFNTLDCMRGIAAAGSREPLEQMIEALAAVFRHAARSAPEIPLAEEMRAIERYMTIIAIRHCGRIALEARITPEAAECLIPKMILQPLVENALIHGLEASSHRGLLTIAAFVDDETLTIVLEDNGRGISSDDMSKLREKLEQADATGGYDGTHIGLINIHRRLRLRYGILCGLTVEAREGGGARVSVRMLAEKADYV
jgi:two-component system sensor histidine kinase YesM